MDDDVIYRKAGDQIVGVRVMEGKRQAAEKLANALVKEIEQRASPKER